MLKKMPHFVRFNSDWMLKDQYKTWLTSVPEDNTKAKYKLCAKSFSLSNIGEQALKSLTAGKKCITGVTQTWKWTQ